MSIYVVYNENGIPVGCTDDKEILEDYMIKLMASNTSKKYYYKKIKCNKIKDISKYDDLFLVRIENTYIPARYFEYMEIENTFTVEETRYLKDILIKNLELRDMDAKERKVIEKAISVVEKWYNEDKEYTPDIDMLNSAEDLYRPYIEGWGE